MGRNAIVFTSNAAHIYSGVLADRATIVDVIKDQQKSHCIYIISRVGELNPLT